VKRESPKPKLGPETTKFLEGGQTFADYLSAKESERKSVDDDGYDTDRASLRIVDDADDVKPVAAGSSQFVPAAASRYFLPPDVVEKGRGAVLKFMQGLQTRKAGDEKTLREAVDAQERAEGEASAAKRPRTDLAGKPAHRADYNPAEHLGPPGKPDLVCNSVS